MSDSPYVPFYPSDWLAGTRGLTAAETGIYITLIAMMYEREAPIQMEEKRLARLCGCTASAFRNAVNALIDEGKIEMKDGGFWNKRVQVEIDLRSKKRTQASKNAKARYEKGEENQRSGAAGAERAQSGRTANQNQNQSKKEEPKGSSKKTGSRLPDDWRLPDGWRQWALAEGMDELGVRREAERFADYWHGVPGQRGVKVDWQATWRNWIRRSLESRPKAKPEIGERRKLPDGRVQVFEGIDGWVEEFG